jgi:inosine/xanthosine triphosphate pyrophosphatase family protein
VDILIGTGNPAKFKRYQTILGQFPHLRVLALTDVRVGTSVVEDGATAEINARKKATLYAGLTGLPTLSVDEALTIPALPATEQPGTNVRRYLGAEATDEALLAAFLEKTRRLPLDERIAIWTYAICLAFPDGRELGAQVELHTLWTARPSLPIVAGYPLSSLLVDPNTGKAIRDLTPEEERRYLQPVYLQVAEIIRVAGLEHE